MRLKRFQTDIFAGIADKNIEFSDGLNIILGKNEAGKSTIINAIYATLFKNAKIRLNYSEDKEFFNRYFPYPDGDYIHGYLEFIVNSKNYVIEKEWSRNDPRQYLKLPDGSRIKNEEKINKLKKDLLLYDKGSYNNIVFTKQRNIKSAIKKIIENEEVINTVNNFLRRAVMELDGISIEELNKKVDNELDNLLKKWDIDNNRPSNPDRDINNPYLKGYGQIYEAYIEKEKLRKKLKRTKKIEEDFEDISNKLRKIKSKNETLTKEINKYEEIEDDIFERGQLEPELKSLKERVKGIKKINQKWPVVKARLADKKEKLKKEKNRLETLKAKKEKAKKDQDYRVLEEKLKKVDKKREIINDLKLEKENLGDITKKKVSELAELKDGISKSRASLEAAKLKVRINFINSSGTKITRGINESENIKNKREFESNGYFRIKTDNLDLEIESAEIDFTKIQEKYKNYKMEYDKLINKMDVKNIEDARNKLEKLYELKNKIKNTEESIEEILGDQDYNQLLKKLREYEFSSNSDDLEIIEEKINELKDEKINELKINIKNKEDKINEWENEYNNQDKLMDKILEIRSKINKKDEKLGELAFLPDKFSSPADFKKYLSKLREEKKSLEDKHSEKKQEMIKIENDLGDNSYEELEIMYKERKKEFEELVLKARKIVKIKNKIKEKLSKMDQNTLKPLTESFSDKLKKLTAQNYKIGKINKEFKLKIKNDSNKYLPADMNYLSYGTYDGVALSLRVAMFETLFNKVSSFIVLDDCLVNLDPERTERAIDLIKDLKNKHQVIFSTCDPNTANKLGGNIIKV